MVESVLQEPVWLVSLPDVVTFRSKQLFGMDSSWEEHTMTDI